MEVVKLAERIDQFETGDKPGKEGEWKEAPRKSTRSRGPTRPNKTDDKESKQSSATADNGSTSRSKEDVQSPRMTWAERVAANCSGQEAKAAVKEDRGMAHASQKSQVKAKPTKIMVDTKGSSYSEVLKKLQKDLPEDLSKGVIGARRSLAGNLVIKLNREADGKILTEAANAIMGEDKAKITRGSMVVVEVKGLDEETEETQVMEAIGKATKGKGQYRVLGIRKYRGDLRIAMVECNRWDARALLELRSLKFGWTSCRLQERQQKPMECGRCLGYGHRAAECKGENRKDCCRRCNGEGHREKGCKEAPKCALCAEKGRSSDHFRGSKGCQSFKEAQDKLASAAIESK